MSNKADRLLRFATLAKSPQAVMWYRQIALFDYGYVLPTLHKIRL